MDRRSHTRSSFPSALALASIALAAPTAHAGERDFVVYAPGMGGTSEQAKPYLDTFLRYLEKTLAWPEHSADGQYFEDPKPAHEYIERSKPGFGMLAPALYLELACGKSPPELLAAVVGVTNVASSGRYHVVAKQGAIKSLDDLKGKKLVSNHLQNLKFVSRVVFGGKIDAEKFFTLEPTNSPVRPFKVVARGEADAALVDDAQLQHMKELPFGQSLAVVYSSEALPPFPVVAFGKVAKPAERDAVRKALVGMCASPTGAPVCKSLQVTKFEALDASAYHAATKEYCKP